MTRGIANCTRQYDTRGHCRRAREETCRMFYFDYTGLLCKQSALPIYFRLIVTFISTSLICYVDQVFYLLGVWSLGDLCQSMELFISHLFYLGHSNSHIVTQV